MMKKVYEPHQFEQKIYKKWENSGNFKAENGSDGYYCIMIPPPNVTGSLHMGHALQHTIMDILVRYERMKGKRVLWQVGTDHAGIATQMVVERQLLMHNETKESLGREAFIEKIWQWKSKSGGMITQQMRRLGNSVDWERERFTMDPEFSRAVNTAFIKLYNDGLIYQRKRLVNWDPKLHTAISDLEVENKEKKGNMWYIKYHFVDQNIKTIEGLDYITVATTRPETLLGDTAIAVHPENSKYQDLIGQKVRVPIVNREIPIIADTYADIEKGTGCVKITPAHDFNDYEVGQRHHLPMINIFDLSAKVKNVLEILNHIGNSSQCYDEQLPSVYHGLDRFQARKVIVEQLEEQQLLLECKEHDMVLPYGDRSQVVIEPMLTQQWYVKIEPLAKNAREVVKNKHIEFIPNQYENMYFSWMNELQDWCISRQLWWGHQIPIWYDDSNNIYVGMDERSVREKYHIADSCVLRQDSDVLDTWFSSSLWTFATLGWPKETELLKKFHPTDVLVTGFDIIFFWVARMIMLTMYLVKDENNQSVIPFKKIFITGLIRDEIGQKMSKSKGNVLDPLDMIDGIDLNDLIQKRTSNLMQPQLADKIIKNTKKQFPDGIQAYGTDSLRFTLAVLTSTGRNINWDMKRLEGYRNFINKIWNASRYVLMHVEERELDLETPIMNLANRWIVSLLHRTILQVEEALSQFRFDIAANVLYDFIWHEFCDWYLEFSKSLLDVGNEKEKQSTYLILVSTLETILRLIHPFMPFVSEEIWLSVAPKLHIDIDTIMLAPYPIYQDSLCDLAVEQQVEWLKNVVVAIRNVRGELNLSPNVSFDVYYQHMDEAQISILQENMALLSQLANTNQFIRYDDENIGLSTTQSIGKVILHIPMKGLIDVEAEKLRVEKALQKLDKEIQFLQSKLNNKNFVDKAPKEVVDKKKQNLEQLLFEKRTNESKIEDLKTLL